MAARRKLAEPRAGSITETTPVLGQSSYGYQSVHLISSVNCRLADFVQAIEGGTVFICLRLLYG